MPGPQVTQVDEVVIPLGVSFTGSMNVASGADVRVAGHIAGSICTEGAVLVEEGGSVTGEGSITCGKLLVAGSIHGASLAVDGLLHVHSSGRIESSEVQYVEIALQQGARVAGPMRPRRCGFSRGDQPEGIQHVDVEGEPRKQAFHELEVDPELLSRLNEDENPETERRAQRHRSRLGQAIYGLMNTAEAPPHKGNDLDVAQPTPPAGLSELRFAVNVATKPDGVPC